MFSQACVKNSVHMGGGRACGREACMAKGACVVKGDTCMVNLGCAG